MMKKYIFLILLILFLVPKSAVFAATRNDLTDCTLREFCDDKDKTTWVKKVSCRPGTEFSEIKKRCDDLSADGLDCRNTDDPICICNFERLPNSCGNRGGIPDSKGNLDSVFGRINPPTQIGSLGTGRGAIENFIQKVIQLIYAISGIGALLMFLWSAFQLITSSGDKEAVAGARKRITWAIVGLVLLALAFPIMRVLGKVIGIPIFS